MYKEQNKFGYFYRNTGLLYDLDKGSFKQAFGDEDMIQNCTCRNDKDGHMLAAAVIGKIDENTYDRLLYPCVLNEEGEKVLLSDSPVKDLITEILCLSGDGSLLYAREDENGKCIYHIVDIDSKEEVQINAVCDNADLNEIGIAPGDCSPVFAMAELDGKIRIYDAAKESVSCELKTEYGTDEIAAMSFCDDDKILAVCTNDKYLRFYDAESGGLLHEEHFEGSDNFFNIKMQIWKDEENSRFCVRLSDGELFMLGTEDFKLISTYEYTASYNPYTREIYRETELSDSIADSGIAGAYLYYPAYTLNELISWGDEFNSDIDRK
jgi:WD40 repeat protein